jgi:DNA-binding MarR family transcriptional regulator
MPRKYLRYKHVSLRLYFGGSHHGEGPGGAPAAPIRAEATMQTAIDRMSEDAHGVSQEDVERVSDLLIRLMIARRPPRRPPKHPAQHRGPKPTPQHILATHILAQHDRQTVGALAEAVGITMGWASRVADDLEQAGLLERERDPNDRRVVWLRASPRARDIDREVRADYARPISAALRGLAAPERAAVLRFLQRLVAESNAQGPPAEPPSPPADDSRPG